MPTVIADFQIMPAERRFSEHLERFMATNQGRSDELQAKIDVAIFNNIQEVREIWQLLEKQEFVSIHQTYAWCDSWIRAKKIIPLIATVSISGKIAAIIPLEINQTFFGPVAQFIGAEQSNINTAVFEREFAQQATPQLMQSVVRKLEKALRPHAVLLMLSNMPEMWCGVSIPFCHLPKLENQNHAYNLPILGSFEETLAQINAKRRRKKYRKSLKILEDNGGFQHIVAQTAEDKEAFLETFFQQKHVRFEAAGLPDVFAPATTRSFFHELAQSDSDGPDYLLKLHALKLNDGHIAAVASLSRKGGHIICQFSSIDESVLAEASPGELLFYLMIEQAQATGASIFDFGIGYQRYKSSWCPVDVTHYDVILPTGPQGWAAALYAGAKTRAKTFIKKNETLYNFVQRCRS